MRRILLSLLMVPIGVILIVWGWLQFTLAEESRGWPEIQGTIVESGIRSDYGERGDAEVESKRAVVVYEFELEGILHRSNRVAWSDAPMGDIERTERYLADYPVGREVTVRYQPGHADNAVLRPGATGGMYAAMAAGAALLILALVAFVLSLLAFRQRKKAALEYEASHSHGPQ